MDSPGGYSITTFAGIIKIRIRIRIRIRIIRMFDYL